MHLFQLYAGGSTDLGFDLPRVSNLHLPISVWYSCNWNGKGWSLIDQNSGFAGCPKTLLFVIIITIIALSKSSSCSRLLWQKFLVGWKQTDHSSSRLRNIFPARPMRWEALSDRVWFPSAKLWSKSVLLSVNENDIGKTVKTPSHFNLSVEEHWQWWQITISSALINEHWEQLGWKQRVFWNNEGGSGNKGGSADNGTKEQRGVLRW